MNRIRVSRRAALLALVVGLHPLAGLAGPRRIVSLGGAVTEILYRLNLGGEIVGVDSTSLYPPAALHDKPDLGYVRSLGAEGILSLRPTLVLAIEGAGPPDAIRLVEQAGIPVIRVPDQASPSGVLMRIAVIAEAVGVAARGAALVEEVKKGFAELDRERAASAASLRVLFVLSLQNGRPLVGGKGTSADAMLSLAGASNAAAALEGWKPLSDEGVIAAAPEALVMMNRGPGGGPADPFALPSFAATPAALGRRLVVMDGNYLLGFGPRAPQAAMDLRRALQAFAGSGTRP